MLHNTFDILIEMRKADREIAEVKSKLLKTCHELINLEKNIENIKNLQLKEQLTVKEFKKKFEDTTDDLENFHEKYDNFIEHLNDYFEIIPEDENDNMPNKAEKLLKEKNHLQSRIEITEKEREDLLKKLNYTDLQINIQKKKNAAMLLRLQRDLQEILQQEQYLSEQLFNTDADK